MRAIVPHPSRFRQRGVVLVLLVLMLALGTAAVGFGLSKSNRSDIEKERITAAALAQAKSALIGYAIGVNDFAANQRPGDLPCPDLNDSGNAVGPCNTPASRLGRLPWKTLGLPDLRDGDGERLWYAVSDSFKRSPRTPCVSPGDAGCLNSDSRGTITVRDPLGNVINNGANPDPLIPSGAIAVILAPGAILTRQGGTLQNRTCTGGPCLATGVCNSIPPTNIEKCKPVNYLDVYLDLVSKVIVDDNADFTDGSNSNGFINGVIRDSNSNVIVNDRLLTISYEDLMPLLERRVAAETLNCLILYAGTNPMGRFPWAATDIATYSDAPNALFGRMPDALLQTASDAPLMLNDWPLNCARKKGNWWQNWKEHVFYGVADAYKPGTLTPSCPACLSVNPPSPATDKQIVVIVTGKRLAGVSGGQPRVTPMEKQTVTNYLEGGNGLNPTFTKQPNSATFNDTVIYN
jgi:type II secretory pathway pseudopilin PulG